MTDEDMDTDIGGLQGRQERQDRRKRIFDPKITLGEILWLVGALGSGLVAFTTLQADQRLDRQRIVAIEERMREQDQRYKDALVELKADVKTIQRTLDDVRVATTLRGAK